MVSSALDVDGQSFNTNVLPALTVAEVKIGARVESQHQIVSFMDIKLATGHFRKAPNVQDFVAYMAEYAGTVFSCRPFHLFVIGMVVYGITFRVGVFDRAGVLLSHEYNLKNNLDIFIRVVRGITCDMSHVELGHDPTVRLAEGHAYDQSEYPNFTMDVGNREVTTHQPPLWVSPFCFGRGTSVWRTKEHSTLQVAWKAEDLMREGQVCPETTPHIPGVTLSIDGGAVYLRPGSGDVEHRIDTQFLHDGKKVPINLILHRSLIPRAGAMLLGGQDHLQPSKCHASGAMLWNAEDDTEWIVALRDALRGYKQSAERGLVLHDISPSTIFLSKKVERSDGVLESPEETPNPSVAHLNRIAHVKSPPASLNHPYSEPPKIQSKATRIAVFMMTGEPQFLAKELFPAVDGHDVACGEHHHLEAFALVAVYVAMVRLRCQFPQDSELAEEFQSVFGNFSVNGNTTVGTVGCPARECHIKDASSESFTGYRGGPEA
ncbi:hypothetical protein DXG03_005397 [Asterophora parasitica]|uniref:Fungal-type protein kinase domain-containing protein n=1 Tax=Asterophora parasitica TaxID=117018 RepID=A0A9P7GEU2_9AGAR|nr:hypothetical protein DXG03_005397 [Asterophora parasitica]